MPARVEFFSAPYSRPNRHFPIGDLSKYLVHSETLMKTSPDMEQIVNVPEFPDWDIVNLVRITDTSYIYWVKASYKRTDLKGQVTFELLFNPITSLISEGDVLKGAWDRLPTNECPYLKEIINTDAMRVTRRVDLPKLPLMRNRQLCWYEIVLRNEIGKPNKERLARYGGFAYLPRSGGTYLEGLVGVDINDATMIGSYPSLNTIINKLDSIQNLSTDGVLGVNVSLLCPFKTYHTINTINLMVGFQGNDVLSYPKKFENTTDEGYWYLYHLEEMNNLPNSLSLKITCDDNERKYGSFVITDESNIALNEIPNEYFENNELNIKISATSDYTGIYTDIEFNESLIRIPTGKVPWVGDSWTDYQVRSMDSDRANMELSIRAAKDQRNIDAVTTMSTSAMSAVMGFAMGGPAGAIGLGVATAATGVAGGEMQGRLSERTARSEQEITEKHQKQQLSNHFDTSYGLIYLTDHATRNLSVTLSMPMNLTQELIDSHTEEYGYKVEGIRSVPVQNGRYQGRLLEIPVAGPKGDLLNAEFIEGVHLTSEDE